MAESATINVEARSETGRREVRKLRATGKVPAIVYGKGEESVSVSVPGPDITKIVFNGVRNVTLQGAASGDAVIRDVQWDTFGDVILHVDFARPKADG